MLGKTYTATEYVFDVTGVFRIIKAPSLQYNSVHYVDSRVYCVNNLEILFKKSLGYIHLFYTNFWKILF